MKIRKGFVSNSSSSSFIVSIDLPDHVGRAPIVDQYDDYSYMHAKEISERIRCDIAQFTGQKRKDQLEDLSEAANSYVYNMLYYYQQKIRESCNIWGLDDNHRPVSYVDMYDKKYSEDNDFKFTDDEIKQIEKIDDHPGNYGKTPTPEQRREYQNIEDSFIKFKADTIAKYWAKKNYAVIEYSDNDGSPGSFFEHTVLPKLQTKTDKVHHALSHH